MGSKSITITVNTLQQQHNVTCCINEKDSSAILTKGHKMLLKLHIISYIVVFLQIAVQADWPLLTHIKTSYFWTGISSGVLHV